MEKKKNNLIPIVIILIVLVLGLGGFIIYDKVLNNNKDNTIVNNNNIKGIFTNSMFNFENSINFANLNLSLLNENSNINNNDFITYLNSYLTYMPLVSKFNNEDNIEENKEIISKVIDNIAIKSGIIINHDNEKIWLIPIDFVDKVLFQYFNIETYNYNLLDIQYYGLVVYDNLQYLKVKKDISNKFNSGYEFIINEVIYEEKQEQILAKGIINSYQIGYGMDSNYYNKSDVYNVSVNLNKLGNIVNIDYMKK